MIYERPPTTPFQNPPRTTTFPFQRYTLVFQQHQDEPIYDVWTRFKNLIQIVPHHGLDLWSLTQFFYDYVDDYTQMDLDFAADGNLKKLSEIANLKAQAKRLFGNEDVWVEMHRGITWDKVENPDPQSTPQVFPSFEEYTPPVTYPEEVEETIRTLIEVEPLDETQLKDLGLNTYDHDIPLSNREVLVETKVITSLHTCTRIKERNQEEKEKEGEKKFRKRNKRGKVERKIRMVD
ncbi:hypothetical protein Tco_0373295 [Tanacetum coccineum]